MNRIINFALYAIAWGAIVAYVILSSTRVAQNRASLSLDSIAVRVVDSTQQSHLVGESKVYKWIESSGYAKLGEPISQVNLSGIESVIGGNGFISQVSAYTNSQGVLHVDVKQREPILRLRLDGYDSYITEDGFVFSSPVGSAHYSLVATGSYKPIFPAGYQGYIDDIYHSKLDEFDQCIDNVEREKYPFFEQQHSLRAEWSEFYRTGYVKKRFMESDGDYAIRLKEKRLSNRARRSELNHQERMLVRKIEQIEQKQIKIVSSKNLFIQKHEDFKKLIIFAKGVERDRFWRAEIVQLVVDTSSFGSIDLKLIPRSADHIVRFGSLSRESDKLDKLEHFYREVLTDVGWERYSVIDVEYKDQVVCR